MLLLRSFIVLRTVVAGLRARPIFLSKLPQSLRDSSLIEGEEEVKHRRGGYHPPVFSAKL